MLYALLVGVVCAFISFLCVCYTIGNKKVALKEAVIIPIAAVIFAVLCLYLLSGLHEILLGSLMSCLAFACSYVPMNIVRNALISKTDESQSDETKH